MTLVPGGFAVPDPLLATGVPAPGSGTLNQVPPTCVFRGETHGSSNRYTDLNIRVDQAVQWVHAVEIPTNLVPIAGDP